MKIENLWQPQTRKNSKIHVQAQQALRKNDLGRLLFIVTEAWTKRQSEEHRIRLEELKDFLLANHRYIVDYRVSK